MVTPEELRLIRHIASKEPTACHHLLEYLLDRLQCEPAAAANPAGRGEADRLFDWLVENRADLVEASRRWRVRAALWRTPDYDDPRDAIRAAINGARA